jgi:iron complex transport system permease protein
MIAADFYFQNNQQRRYLVIGLLLMTGLLCLAGLCAGSEGWSGWAAWHDADMWLIVSQIRAPRTVGAWLTGALLGLAGATAQGLFRNPLADPYLLGSASGASLGVVVVLVGSTLAESAFGIALATVLMHLGLVGGAFAGALLGVTLTLALARGVQHTTRLLLSGVVVGVMLAAVSDLITTAAPDALRGKQAFLLGSTGFLSWQNCAVLALGLIATLPICWRLARALDALTLGVESAQSLGLALPRIRLTLVLTLALATGLAVSQTGLIAFVGLVAPHLVRRFAPATQGYTLVVSAAAGGVLLLMADVLARSLLAPRELPVGVLTALLGGGYLVGLLHRRRSA